MSKSGTASAVESLPLVSVCVPTTGRMEYLPTALDSVLAQTYANIEVLVLDNASPRDANTYLESRLAGSTRSRILRVEERVPMFENFNRGFAAAVGKYVVFVHDDDVYQPEFIEKHVALLEACPGAAFAGGNFDIIDAEGRTVRKSSYIQETGSWTAKEFIRQIYQKGVGSIPTPGIVFRREDSWPGGFDPEVPLNWGDFTILMRIAEGREVAVLDETCYAWRVHGENGSSIPISRSIPLRAQVLEDYLEEYFQRHPSEGAFVDELRRMNDRSRRIGLIWGWLSDTDAEDAAACRELLEESRLMRVAGGIVSVLERLGLSARRRQWMLRRLWKARSVSQQ